MIKRYYNHQRCGCWSLRRENSRQFPVCPDDVQLALYFMDLSRISHGTMKTIGSLEEMTLNAVSHEVQLSDDAPQERHYENLQLPGRPLDHVTVIYHRSATTSRCRHR